MSSHIIHANIINYLRSHDYDPMFVNISEEFLQNHILPNYGLCGLTASEAIELLQSDFVIEKRNDFGAFKLIGV